MGHERVHGCGLEEGREHPGIALAAQGGDRRDLHRLVGIADGVEPVHLATYDRFMALAGGYGDASFSVTLPLS